MCNGNSNWLPMNTHKLITLCSPVYATRQRPTFKQHSDHTNLRKMCISFKRVALWNSHDNSIKCTRNVHCCLVTVIPQNMCWYKICVGIIYMLVEYIGWYNIYIYIHIYIYIYIYTVYIYSCIHFFWE